MGRAMRFAPIIHLSWPGQSWGRDAVRHGACAVWFFLVESGKQEQDVLCTCMGMGFLMRMMGDEMDLTPDRAVHGNHNLLLLLSVLLNE
jgi:hypothetical protein